MFYFYFKSKFFIYTVFNFIINSNNKHQIKKIFNKIKYSSQYDLINKINRI